jgi:rhamnosyltransferase
VEATPRVAAVIRTLNEAALIGRCLETLRAQAGGFCLEPLVIDSGSSDGTVEIARRHGAAIIEIPPHEFHFSKTLNLGIERVSAELVVVLSAHAIPTDTKWLATLAAHFSDPRLAGVCCRQVPWPGSDWHEALRLARTFGERGLVFSDPADPAVVFSNAASCIRRSVWQRHPFTLPAAEDLDWARRVIGDGWRVAYEPRVAVFHSPAEPPARRARRLAQLTRADDEVRRRRRTLGVSVREAAGLLARDVRDILSLDASAASKLRNAWTSSRTALGYLRELARDRDG